MLPWKYFSEQLIRKIKNRNLSTEAFFPYFHKLPANIHVTWSREGKYIVGVIRVENNEFMTQALSAEEFVEMVNDTLLAAYEIPPEYCARISSAKKFIPQQQEFDKLNNKAIKHSSMNFDLQLVTA